MNLHRIIKITERTWYFGKWPLFATVFLALIHTFIFTIFVVDGPSMKPTLQDKQVLLVNKIQYLLSSPKAGEIVILQFPGDSERRMFVKRVKAVPGDRLEAGLTDRYGNVTDQNVNLKNGEYYVLGDNRDQSGDSRLWGPAYRENIIGKVFMY